MVAFEVLNTIHKTEQYFTQIHMNFINISVHYFYEVWSVCTFILMIHTTFRHTSVPNALPNQQLPIFI